MKYRIDHNVDSSVFLWLDNLLLEQNEGSMNYSGSCRQTSGTYAGWRSYSAPHRQFAYDSTISGSVVPSGAYVNGTFTPTGTGLKIDFNRGQVISTTALSNVSLRYSFKEVNIYQTSNSEQSVLFENRFVQNPRSLPQNDSFDAAQYVYPCIFIKSSAGENETLCFDGCVSTVIPVRLVFLADSFYLYRSVTSILRDQKEAFIPLFSPEEMPFDRFQSLTGVNFDYSSQVSVIQEDTIRLACIKDVTISDFQDRVNSLMGAKVFGGFIDLELELLRFPRS